MQQTQSEITYIVPYRCPNCQVGLEARTSEANSWLRCPNCGRASLPPEPSRTPRVEPILPGNDVLVIGPGTDVPGPYSGAPTGYHRSYPGAVRRVVMTLFVLSSLWALTMGLVTGDSVRVAVSGGITILLLVIMGLMASRR